MTHVTLIRRERPLLFTRSREAVEAWISADDLCALAGADRGGSCDVRHHLLAVVPRAWVQRLWAMGRGQLADGTPLLAPDGRLVLVLRRAATLAAGAALASSALPGVSSHPLSVRDGTSTIMPATSRYSGVLATDPHAHDYHHVATSTFHDTKEMVQSQSSALLHSFLTGIGRNQLFEKRNASLMEHGRLRSTASLVDSASPKGHKQVMSDTFSSLSALSDLFSGANVTTEMLPVDAMVHTIQAAQRVDYEQVHSATCHQMLALAKLGLMKATMPELLHAQIDATLKQTRLHDQELVEAGRAPPPVENPEGGAANVNQLLSSLFHNGRAAVEDAMFVDAGIALTETLKGSVWQQWGTTMQVVGYGSLATNVAKQVTAPRLAAAVNAAMHLSPQMRVAGTATVAAIASGMAVVAASNAFLAEVGSKTDIAHAALTRPRAVQLWTLCDMPAASLHVAWDTLRRFGPAALPPRQLEMGTLGHTLLDPKTRETLGVDLALAASRNSTFENELSKAFGDARKAWLKAAGDRTASLYLNALEDIDSPTYFHSPRTLEHARQLPPLPSDYHSASPVVNTLSALWLLKTTVGGDASIQGHYSKTLRQLAAGEQVLPKKLAPLQVRPDVSVTFRPTPVDNSDAEHHNSDAEHEPWLRLQRIMDTLYTVRSGVYYIVADGLPSVTCEAVQFACANWQLIVLALLGLCVFNYTFGPLIYRLLAMTLGVLGGTNQLKRDLKRLSHEIEYLLTLWRESTKQAIHDDYRRMADATGELPFATVVISDTALADFLGTGMEKSTDIAWWIVPINSYFAMLTKVMDIPPIGHSAKQWPPADDFSVGATPAREAMMRLAWTYLPEGANRTCFTADAYRRLYKLQEAIMCRLQHAALELSETRIHLKAPEGEFDLALEWANTNRAATAAGCTKEHQHDLYKDFLCKASAFFAGHNATMMTFNIAGRANVSAAYSSHDNPAGIVHIFSASAAACVSLLEELMLSRQANARLLRDLRAEHAKALAAARTSMAETALLLRNEQSRHDDAVKSLDSEQRNRGHVEQLRKQEAENYAQHTQQLKEHLKQVEVQRDRLLQALPS